MATMEEIADKAQEIFDETYSTQDILKGNVLEMHQECWEIARYMLEVLGEKNEPRDTL